MSKQSVIVDGVEYVRADIAQPGNIGDLRIIVADRGWVFAGRCTDNEDGSVTITNASNIRTWGTTKGLGQLVNGPLSGTKFDPYGTIRCMPIVTIAANNGW